MKTLIRKVYRGVFFVLFLSIMLLCTVLLLAFLADPTMMYATIKKIFGVVH
ncbi:hypothetical protein [Thermoflavimicrobium daqui]|uniref:hypothetical protein n=1 Tax=Thermoflavimicrobium daqui TaxID=2137476 RepID=UPI00143CE931|nr:hypothetical protein [Thermoflavimicrobium daqui]